MRRAVKLSLGYLLVCVITFTTGNYVLPDVLVTGQEYTLTAIYAALYFVFLPLLYWRWVIKAGNKKVWRLVIAFSLSFFAARYTFPNDIASYFEFMAWLRYPFIAIVLFIELGLMFTIMRGLWQARDLGGDPRIGALSTYQNKPAEHMDLALVFSYEPASWYYAVPYLSRTHEEAIGKLKLRSATVWMFVITVAAIIAVSTLIYALLLPINELLAIVASAFTAYCVIMATANYRVSRYYSVYATGDKLILNSTLFNFLVIDRHNIASIQQGEWLMGKHDDVLTLGSGSPSVEITFKGPQDYYGLMGMVTEKVDQVRLSIVDSQGFIERLNTKLAE